MYLTLTHAVDKAGDHEDGVEVPLLLQVSLQLPPEGEGEALGRVPPVLYDPVESEGQLTMEEDLDQQGQHAETAARTSSHLLVRVNRRLYPESIRVRSLVTGLRPGWVYYDIYSPDNFSRLWAVIDPAGNLEIKQKVHFARK